jgi:hypothetical protein
MREYILAGKSNQETWELCKVEFHMPDSKKHYPAWYRGELRQKLGVKDHPELKSNRKVKEVAVAACCYTADFELVK